ncbi:Kelch repeat-containing protein [Enhygromyxa salina]|uniref:N-acetylneuraminate epimerase n=1 Tax=Enhygromyxa salina TaxID=215803 RepID=A0A2S9XPQ2_9BACT|nr:hypothetical protein [Enhygromyxa salina]PRP94835.1 N-acetylneuraminate epimerase [Enhygromyxa salina]
MNTPNNPRSWQTPSLYLVCLLLGCAATEREAANVVAPTAQADAPAPSPAWKVDAEQGPPLLPEGVTSFGATNLGDDVYVLGGYQGTPHRYDNTGQSSGFLRLSAGAREWETLGEVVALQSVALDAVNGQIVRVGGMRIHNDPGQPADMRSLAEVAFYQPDTGTWTQGPPLPQPRSSHEIAVIDQVIYVLGGWALDGDSDSGVFRDQALSLDMSEATPSWKSFAAPFRRRALGVAAAGGKLYALGGMDDTRSISAEVNIYDPSTGSWSRGPDFPGSAFGLAAAAVGDTVFASGDDGVIYGLAPGAEQWVRAGSLSFPRFFHQIVETEGQLLAVGGIHGMSKDARTRQVERVAINDPNPNPILGVWRIDSPAQAKNRMGMVVAGDALYLFGGNRSIEQHDFGAEDFLDEGFRLHLPSMTWSEIAPLPVRRQTMQTVMVGDSLLAVGGFGHDGESARTHGDAYQYNFATDAWTERPGAIKGTRSQFGLAAHGGELWVFGGLDYDPAREGDTAFDHRTDVLVAPADDPSASFEPSGVTLPSPRRAFGGAVLDGRYYMVGGMHGDFAPVTTCDAFEFATKSWSSFSCPPSQLLSAQLVVIGEALYLVGGSKMGDAGLEPNLEVLRYDPRGDQWTTVLDEIPLPPKHLRAFEFNGRLLLFSAHFEGVSQAKVALIRVGET